MLSPMDKEIIRHMQENLPLHPQPFKIIAQRINISEEILLKRVKELKEKGYIRRIGATLRHRQMGLKANPMIVWQVPQEKIEEVGQKLASIPEITHCYQRPPLPNLKYNVYSMIHGESKEECLDLVKKIAEFIGIDKYKLLYSVKEFKKTSMRYFLE